MEIYLVKNETQDGPFSYEDVQKLINTGEASSNDLCWHAELTEWVPISEILQMQAAPPPIPSSLPKAHDTAQQIQTGSISENLPSCNLFSHIDSINELIASRDKVEQENAILAAGVGSDSSMFAKNFAAGNLHNDPFGHIYGGNSPFAIGQLSHPTGSAGVLNSDPFGNIHSGSSPFTVGHLGHPTGSAGILHQDEFGHLHSGNSPFDAEHL